MELFNEIHSGCKEAGLFQPLIRYICAKKNGLLTPPYVPHWDPMPLHKLCQLALLWQIAGFEKEFAELAATLASLRPFPSLWCPENEFNEKEILVWFSRLPIAAEPMPDFSSFFTLDGNGTSLGVIKAGPIEIRAFGPQSHLTFGIKGKGQNNWTCCHALPEVWLEVKTDSRETECKLDIRFIGLKPENPLEFAFYVKAPSCQIGNEILKPKSLRRFHGEATTLTFQNLKIESAFPHKVQVIPLAGEGCFWDTTFLASFEIHPFQPQASFAIKNNI